MAGDDMQDFEKNSAKYFKKALQFYSSIGQRLTINCHVFDIYACALDQVPPPSFIRFLLLISCINFMNSEVINYINFLLFYPSLFQSLFHSLLITVPGPSVIPAASIYSQSIFVQYYAMFEVLLIVKTYQKNRFSPL